MSKQNNIKVGISAALKVDFTKNEIQLTPDGEFSARDGRPTSCKCWIMNAANAQEVIAKLSKRKSKILIDFEHHSLKTDTGIDAKASGWFYGKNVVYRPGLGLFATEVEWTANAVELIKNKEYLYISPVVIYNAKTGDILDIYNAALTNDPAIDGMNEVELAAASNLLIQQLTNQEEILMDEILVLLRKILGLPKDATEADVLAALQQIDQKVAEDAASNLIKLLDKKSQTITALTTQVSSQKTAIDALKAKKDGDVDPTKYVPIEAVQALTAQVNELKKEVTGDKVTALVEAALSSGKLLPAMQVWATNLGNKDYEALKAFVEGAPEIAALNGNQTGSKEPGKNELGLTPDEMAVAKCSGLTPEEFAAAKKENK